MRIHVRFQNFNPILLTRKSFTFSLIEWPTVFLFDCVFIIVAVLFAILFLILNHFALICFVPLFQILGFVLFVIFQILLFATLCHVRIHVRFQIFNPILLTRKSFTFSLTRPLFNKDHFEVFPSSIISDNSVYVVIICIRVIFTIMLTIVLMVLFPLNKVGSMTHITQVDIRVNVYNFINFSLTIVKSFFGHKDMTFYKPSL